MNILLIILCLAGFIFGLRQRNKINPFTLFFGIWLIISVAANLKLFHLLEASDLTYGIMLAGSAVFFIGILFGEKIFTGRKLKTDHKKKRVEYELNYKLMYVLSAITIIVYTFYLGQTAIQLLSGHDLGYVRQMAQQGQMYNVPFMNMLRILIAFPFTYVIALVTPTDIFFGKKDKVLIILTAIIMALRILSDGSRSAVVWLIISMLICFLYKRKKEQGNDKVGKKHKKLLLLLFLVPVALLVFATLSRSGSETTRFTYYYFSMEPKMFENWMGIADQSGVLGFGMAAFNGFFFVLFYIVTNIFSFITAPMGYQSVYNLLEGVGTNWQTITEQGTKANSYASTFFTFYVDGRVVGVIIGMLLFGLVAGYYYKKVRTEDKNLLCVSLYNFIMMGIFFSFIQFPLKSPFNALALVMLVTVVYKRKKINTSEEGWRHKVSGIDGKKKPKILAVSHSVEMSGANKSFLDVLRGLKETCEIVVLVNAKSGGLIDQLKKEHIRFIYAKYGWSYIRPRKNLFKKIVRTAEDLVSYYSSFGRGELSDIMESEDFDLVYTNTSVVDVGARVARRYHLPHVWHIREFGEEDFGLRPIRRKGFRTKLVAEAKCVIVISKALAKKYDKITKNVEVVYNGFQVGKLSGKGKGKRGRYKLGEEIKILVVGQVTAAKGQEVAVMAVEKLIEDGWKAKLILAGKVEREYLTQIAKEVGGMPKWLEVKGEVANLYDLRKTTDFELMCSKNEAFGRVTIEAMLHEVPVIGSDSGGTSELISDGETGLTFRPGDDDDLYKKILEDLEDGGKRVRMVEKAKSFASGFTIDNTVNKVTKIMGGILEGVSR